MKVSVGTILLSLLAGALHCVAGPQPIVAVHDSELTRALETMNATGATPSGPGTSGKQWWPTNWHYFVMPESVQEMLRSDGTAFTVVGDSNIVSGVLTNADGTPKYPIMISLACEAIPEEEIGALTNYVAAGGFLFVGSSSFTRHTNGVTRTNFALAGAMGLNMVNGALTNWGVNQTFSNTTAHRLTEHIPSGRLVWQMPSSAEEVSWPQKDHLLHPAPNGLPHWLWRVQTNGAQVIARGDSSPYLLVRPFGKGWFIYDAGMQPFLGHGSWAPGMYAYGIARQAIEWAFESSKVPVTRLSPWPYAYDAAVMFRHDMEAIPYLINSVEASAQFEFNNGAKGEYYFCTGTLRVDYDTAHRNSALASLRRAMTNYGALFGPHNGGLTNINTYVPPLDHLEDIFPDLGEDWYTSPNPYYTEQPTLNTNDYDYWHWGPDDMLDRKILPPGFTSGTNYARTSVSNSFTDIAGWGLTNNNKGLKLWCAPFINATREGSLQIEEQLGVKVAGETKLGPFPHWIISKQTSGKRYPFLTLPVSDWFVGANISQSQEEAHTTNSLRTAVDYYYDLGALINFYCHNSSATDGRGLANEYVKYTMNTNLHPRLWSANAVDLFSWWQARSNAQVTVGFSTNGGQSLVTFSIKGATHTNTTVETSFPNFNSFCNLQVSTNGILASGNAYRTDGQRLKVRVGTTVTNVLIGYFLPGPALQVFSENFDGVTAPALPAGWTTSATGAQSNWVTQTSVRDTVPNAPFSPNPTNVGVNQLVSPSIPMPEGEAQLAFRNNYNLEAEPANLAYDGGVLEIKIGAGGFQDILSAGGNFISGGYTHTISTNYNNPLGNRQVWSGNSGGFITTLVNLPAAASGQIIQLRWRCGTDAGVGSVGWRIDTISITNRACGGSFTNFAPVLPAQTNRTIAELTTLTVTNTATDPDIPANVLVYLLTSAPTNAAIDASGVITWTPTETQGPGTNTFTTVVTDNGSPPLKATNSFVVTVSEANSTPVLPAQTDRTIFELTTLTVTNTATDSDLPTNILSYILTNQPAGAQINTNGVITWTPSAAQGPGVYTITTIVTDSGTPVLRATNSFVVTVLDTNSCNFNQIFTQNFDGVTAPALPAGWTTSSTGAQSNWATQTSVRDTLPNAPFSPDPTNIGTSDLVSPAVALPTGLSRLVFRNNYDLEAGIGGIGYDGGVLEIKIGAGAFTDIIAAGGSFTAGGYSHTIDTNYSSPIAGRQAWSGNSSGFITTMVDLPGAASGQTIQLRWRCASDFLGGGVGWRVDTVSISNFVCDVPGNDPPVANNQNVATLEDTLTNIVLTATDVDSANLSYAILNNPTNGVLGVLNTNTGAVSYTPNANYNGPDSFSFTVTDGSLLATGLVSITVIAVNDAPTLVLSTNNVVVSEDIGPVTMPNFVAITTGPPNESTQSITNIMVLSVSNAAFFAAGPTLTTNGTLSFTPAANFNGVANITIQARDNGGIASGGTNGSVATNFTITVVPVNDAPVANNQNVATLEDTLTNIVLTATDLDSTGLNFAIIVTPTNGTLGVLNTNTGGISYTPTNNYNGPDTFRFTVSDGSLLSTGTVSITVIAVNDAPTLTLVGNNVIVFEDSGLVTLNGFASATTGPTNESAQAITNIVVLSVSNATLFATNPAISTSGTLTFTPAVNSNGVAAVTVQARDNGGTANGGTNGSTAQTFTVTVTADNDTPIANNQSLTNAEDTTFAITLSGSDIDGPLTNYTVLAQPTNGTLSGVAPNLSYRGATNYFGPDSFTFVRDDGSLTSAVATVSITLSNLNDAPLANNQNVATLEDTLTNIVLSATDVDSTNLSFSILVNPTNGTLGILSTNTGAVSYTPTNNYNGPDTFRFRVSDGSLLSTGTVSITVIAVNDAPGATSQSLTNGEDTTFAITLSGSDIDGPLTNYTVVTLPTNGVLSGSAPNLNYRGNTNFFGPDGFSFVRDDGSLTSAVAIVTITLTNLNDAPVAHDQSVATPEDTSTNIVLAAGDVDSTNMSFGILVGPTHGALGIVSTNTGAVSYTPSANYTGADGFSFSVTDGSLLSTGTVSITVMAVNNVPLANSQSLTNGEDTSFAITLSGTDVDGPLTNYTMVALPTNGVLSGSAPNLTYHGATNYVGSDSFSFVRDDGSLTSAVATVSITLTNVNDAPLANNQAVATLEDTLTNIVLSATDVDSANLGFAVLTIPTNGVLGVLSTNTDEISYTPNADYNGEDTFTFTVTDGSLLSTGTVSVTVLAVNDAPVANNNQNVATLEDTLTNIVLSATDVDGPNLSFAILATPAHGSLGILNTNSDGIGYTPNTNHNGPDSFTFTVTDGTLLSTGTVSVTVIAVNDAPELPPQPDRTIDVSFTLLVTNSATDADVPANVLTYALIVGPTNAVIDTNGVISWTPTSVQGSSTNEFTTLVMDDGVPNLSATNTFLVVVNAAPVIPQPVIQSITLSNDIVTIVWDSISNQVYRLQFIEDMALTNWTDVPPDVSAIGPSSSATNTVADAPQRFYRVMLVQ